MDTDLPVDYLVYRPAEVAERLSLGDPFVTCVLREGWVLYGSPHDMYSQAESRKQEGQAIK